jgi:DNA adenine methylase
MKSCFRYPGGKSRVANLILKYMPEGTVEYREPFVGGGGVFFNLPSSVQSKWINDLNKPLIEVYLAFRDRPVEFIKACREISPIVAGEIEVPTKGTGKPYNARLGKLFEEFKYNEGMDQALRYFFINRTVWAGRVNYDPAFESRLYYSNPTGWNITKGDLLERVADHIAGTKITALDYSELLDGTGDGVWVYLDPPYVVDTRLARSSKLYECGFSDEDHVRFAEVCKRTGYKVCISYDNDPKVYELFSDAGFHIYEHSWTYSGTQVCSRKRGVYTAGEDKKAGKELIITNYERDEARFKT